MKISYKQEDIHEPDTVTITCSKAEAAALKYYAECYARIAASVSASSARASAAAELVPGNSNLFNFSIEFQSKLFR